MTYLLLWGFFALVAASLAGAKGRSACGWFILGLLVGPFAWVVALLPSLKTSVIILRTPAATPAPGPQLSGPADFRCCHCAHLNFRGVWKCAKCGQDLSPPLFG